MSNSNNLHFLFVLEACFQKSCMNAFRKLGIRRASLVVSFLAF
jgi:hypothetical protein